MKIESLTIRNFRGVRAATFEALQNMVVIAGQNGSGKSTKKRSLAVSFKNSEQRSV
jgi:recombinational DNA repair ATPase RecF